MPLGSALLAILCREPMKADRLRSDFESATGDATLSLVHLYSTLTRLEKSGQILVTDGDEQAAVYSITETGRVAVQDWFATPVDPPDTPTDEFVTKVALAMSTPTVDIKDILIGQRDATVRRLQTLADPQAEGAEEIASAALLRNERLRLLCEAELRWIDYCESQTSA